MLGCASAVPLDPRARILGNASPIGARLISHLHVRPDRVYNRAIRMREQPFLPRRHSVRLPTFDYSQPASYFLTICTQEKRRLFGHVLAHAVTLNALGQIAEDCWRAIPRHFPNIKLGPDVIMPNHVHGIIIIRQQVPRPVVPDDGEPAAKHPRRARHAVPLRPEETAREFATPTVRSIPTIVGAFKAAVSRQASRAFAKPAGSIWQRGYYEHVIRDEDDFRNTCEYIRMNPARWEFDEENS